MEILAAVASSAGAQNPFSTQNQRGQDQQRQQDQQRHTGAATGLGKRSSQQLQLRGNENGGAGTSGNNADAEQDGRSGADASELPAFGQQANGDQAMEELEDDSETDSEAQAVKPANYKAKPRRKATQRPVVSCKAFGSFGYCVLS